MMDDFGIDLSDLEVDASACCSHGRFMIDGIVSANIDGYQFDDEALLLFGLIR